MVSIKNSLLIFVVTDLNKHFEVPATSHQPFSSTDTVAIAGFHVWEYLAI